MFTKFSEVSDKYTYNYRPQRSCGKVMFSQACVKNSVHGGGVCLSACWDTLPHADTTPQQTPPPQADTHPWADPFWEDTPWQVHPLRQTPQWADPSVDTLPGHPPPSRHPSPDGHCSGRYISYWNVFLLKKII